MSFLDYEMHAVCKYSIFFDNCTEMPRKSTGSRHVDLYVDTNVSEENYASVFKAENFRFDFFFYKG